MSIYDSKINKDENVHRFALSTLSQERNFWIEKERKRERERE